MTGNERRQVELVSPDGRPIGTSAVDDAHRGEGTLHRAFSIFLRNSEGDVLLQRRAFDKSRFAGLWSNACCSHPAPGVDVKDAAFERLEDELGISGVDLVECGTFVYRAKDPSSEYAEFEFDHVFLGSTDVRPVPNPDEVAECRWESVDTIGRELATSEHLYTPWFRDAAVVAGLIT